MIFTALRKRSLTNQNERNVEVVLGAQGDAKLAVEAYLRGELESTGSVCHEHEHADECGEH